MQWASNDLRMRARRVAKRLSRDSSETRVKPRRKPLKPRSRWSGIRAQHESESELPPGANDYETTALSASPIVRDICLNFSIELLCEPNLSDTHAKRTFALRRQSRWVTLNRTKTEFLPTCANQKYNMTCEAWYLWVSREAHFRVETPIKMSNTQPNKDRISTDLCEPKI